MSYISGIRLQAADDAGENASWYGECASEPRIYAYVGNDPLNGVDPSGLDTYFAQVGASLVGLVGGLVNGGFYVTTNNAYGLPDIGVHGTAGFAVGLGAGVSVTGGYATGSTSDFRARSVNIDASAFLVTGTASFTPSGSNTLSNFAGASGGLSFGTPGADLSTTQTRTFGLIENVIGPAVQNAWASVSGLFSPAQTSQPTGPGLAPSPISAGSTPVAASQPTK
jgi:hypothetical protein